MVLVSSSRTKKAKYTGYSHGYQGKWDSNWHAHNTPYKPLPVQRLSLRRKSLENALGLARWYHGAGEAQLDLLPPLDVVLIAGGQRRYRLEAPFLIRDTSKGVVSIVDDLSLPARLHLLP